MPFVWPQSRGRFYCYYCGRGPFRTGRNVAYHVMRQHPRSGDAYLYRIYGGTLRNGRINVLVRKWHGGIE